MVTRDYAKEPIPQVKYVRPKPVTFDDFKRTGDLGIEHGVQPTDYPKFYAQSKELEDANELVKRAFTLYYLPRKETVRARGEKIMGKVKRHQHDRGSPEVTIASLTNEIHQLKEIYEKNPTDKTMKVFLNEIISIRGKWLTHLRKWDYKRFEWVLEQLNLIYKPIPTVSKVSGRRDAMRILTDRYCEDYRQQQLDAYRRELDDRKPEFYERKARVLWEILQEEEKHGISPSVTRDDILQAINKFKSERSKIESRNEKKDDDL